MCSSSLSDSEATVHTTTESSLATSDLPLSSPPIMISGSLMIYPDNTYPTNHNNTCLLS